MGKLTCPHCGSKNTDKTSEKDMPYSIHYGDEEAWRMDAWCNDCKGIFDEDETIEYANVKAAKVKSYRDTLRDNIIAQLKAIYGTNFRENIKHKCFEQVFGPGAPKISGVIEITSSGYYNNGLEHISPLPAKLVLAIINYLI